MIITLSCSPDQNTISPTSDRGQDLSFRSDCNALVINRLRISEDLSVKVDQCYTNGELSSVDYSLVASISEDKYALLNLNELDNSEGSIRINAFNIQIESIDFSGDLNNSYLDVDGNSVE